MMECRSVGRGLAMKDGDKVSIAAQLDKLEAMRANGTLTEAGYQKLKAGLIEGAGPKASPVAAWLIGALAAVAVVVVLFLVVRPRHGTDKGPQIAAQPVATVPAMKSEAAASPVDRAANDATAEIPAGPA